MPRDYQQDIAGYKVAIRSLEKEYKRAMGNTTRTKEVFQGMLDRFEYQLDVLRRELRELLSNERKCTPPRSGTNGKKKSSASAHA